MNDGSLFTAVAAVSAALASIVVTVLVALDHRTGPLRCPPGLVAAGARCCGEGQENLAGRCSGVPKRCAVTQAITREGCVAHPVRISYTGGKTWLAGVDWDGARGARGAQTSVGPFALDASEVTIARYAACSSANVCSPLLFNGEPGEPVRGLNAEQAETFCRHEGGRLPTAAEWGFAAMGAEARRFAWGATGLVCRRAAYGLVQGPCAEGGEGPELAGARPDGATPEGALDLAGNVAEWTRETRGYVARGGSFRSRTAGELKTFSAESSGPRLDIGFRCAYPGTKARRAAEP